MDYEKNIKSTNILNRITNFIELAIAFTLIAGIIVLFAGIIWEYGLIAVTSGNFDFSEFMSKSLSLIIGLEFVRMLCRHSPDSIIEVLMFACARQLIISHDNTISIFLGVISIGILFAIRKFLLSKAD